MALKNEMRDRIQFVSEQNSFDDMGFPVKSEVVAYECWANKKVLSSTKEFLSSNTNNSLVVLSFKVRNCIFIRNVNSLSYQIRYKGELYNIVQVDDTDVAYVYFKCEKVN